MQRTWRRICAGIGSGLALIGGARAQAPAGEHLGPATCNATSCHGATRAGSGRVTQDEYTTWFVHDRHRKAWEVLSDPLGQAMGQRLRIDVATANECLVCHAVPAGPSGGVSVAGGGADDVAPRFVEFGVSCEACHGPASGWYGTHFQGGWSYEQAVAREGLVDLRAPEVLAQTCTSCHVGDSAPRPEFGGAARTVDHRLIAAGHPQLAFEAGSFLLGMTPHWRQRGEESRAWYARTALIGAAVSLREQLEKLAQEAAAARDWPEYSSLDCASCHHDLASAGWRRLRDFRSARGLATPVGQPPLDGAWLPAAHAVLAATEPELDATLTTAIDDLERLLAQPLARRAEIAAAAGSAAALCDRAVASLAAKLAATGPSTALAADALAYLARDADLAAARGRRGAEHAAQLLHSLRARFAKGSWKLESPAAAAILRDLLDPLGPADARPDAFDPEAFARRLAELAGGE